MSHSNLPWYAASKVYASHPPSNVSSLGGCDFVLMSFPTTPNAEQLARIHLQINQPIIYNVVDIGWLIYGQKNDSSWGITKLDDTCFPTDSLRPQYQGQVGKPLRCNGKALPQKVWHDIASKGGHTVLSCQFPTCPGSLNFNFLVSFAEQDESAVDILNEFFELLKKDPNTQCFFSEQFIDHNNEFKTINEFTAAIDWSYTTITPLKEGLRIYPTEMKMRVQDIVND
jgi:hypothetical protein